jgi:hypothetical protein
VTGGFLPLSPCGQLWGNGGDIVGYSPAYADKTGRRQYILFVNLDEMSFTRPIMQALNTVAISAYCG